jgi:arginyl-tRNA synthetase
VTLDEVAAAVRLAVDGVLRRRLLDPAALPAVPPLSRPRHARHGDLVSTLILRGGVPAADRAEIAAEVARDLAGGPGIASAWADGPGFVGIRLDDASVARAVRDLVRAGAPAAPALPVEPPDWLAEAVGRPAARYAWAGPDRPDHADAARWTRANDGNSYYLVQYAGVTAGNVGRWAAGLGVIRSEALPAEERGLQVDLAIFPWSASAPDAVTRALARVAAGYLRFVTSRRVLPVGDEPIGEELRTRLWLTHATRVVVTAGLDRLGIAAAERI